MNKTPKITLVGAGPGDPDLISIKGLKAIKTADVILYDALVNKVLLENAAKDALVVFVGKRANKHRYTQDKINEMLVAYAFNYGHVVRLKGGDPFVFGRGHEELEYAKAFNVAVEIVPGISSAIAVPALQGIPLTKRGVNESFWVLTATAKKGRFAEDLALAVKSSATLVILMGLGKLSLIVELLKAEGKSESPIAVIQNGSLSSEKKALGTVDSILEEVKLQKIGTPAIIIIGNVVNEHPEINWVYIEENYLNGDFS